MDIRAELDKWRGRFTGPSGHFITAPMVAMDTIASSTKNTRFEWSNDAAVGKSQPKVISHPAAAAQFNNEEIPANHHPYSVTRLVG